VHCSMFRKANVWMLPIDETAAGAPCAPGTFKPRQKLTQNQ
jgi:hypothetical protein